MKKYRVLVVDDSKKVLDIIKSKIYGRSYKGWEIEICTVQVEVEEMGGNYHIAEKSIEHIAVLSKQPFDLLLMDFGYRHSKVKPMELIKKEKYEQEELYEFEKFILNPYILVEEGKRRNNGLYDSFIKNFVGFEKNIYVYTFHPKEYKERMFGLEDYCRSRVKEAFRNAKVSIIDTRTDFFNDSEYYEKIKTKYDSYYEFILAQYLKHIIYLDIAEKEVDDAKHIKTPSLLSENQPLKSKQNKKKITEDKINKKVLFWTILGVVVAAIIGVVSIGIRFF